MLVVGLNAYFVSVVVVYGFIYVWGGWNPSNPSKIRSLGVSFGLSNLIAKCIRMLTKNIFIFNFNSVLFC